MRRKLLRRVKELIVEAIEGTASGLNELWMALKALAAYIKADRDSVNSFLGMLAGLLMFGVLVLLWILWPYIELYFRR